MFEANAELTAYPKAFPLLLDLPTNSSFIERRILIIPRDALNLLLELIRLNIGWQDLPK